MISKANSYMRNWKACGNSYQRQLPPLPEKIQNIDCQSAHAYDKMNLNILNEMYARQTNKKVKAAMQL